MLLYLVFGLLGCVLLLTDSRHKSGQRFLVAVFLLAISIHYAFSMIIYQLGLAEILREEDASGRTGGISS